MDDKTKAALMGSAIPRATAALRAMMLDNGSYTTIVAEPVPICDGWHEVRFTIQTPPGKDPNAVGHFFANLRQIVSDTLDEVRHMRHSYEREQFYKLLDAAAYGVREACTHADNLDRPDPRLGRVLAVIRQVRNEAVKADGATASERLGDALGQLDAERARTKALTRERDEAKAEVDVLREQLAAERMATNVAVNK